MILGQRLQINKPGLEVSTLKTGLLHCWELDETSGSIAYDSHGSEHGTILGPAINQAGKIGTCYNFQGTGEGIEFSDISPLTSVSISQWVKMNTVNASLNDRHVFLSKGDCWRNQVQQYNEYGTAYYAEGGKMRFDIGLNNTYGYGQLYSTVYGFTAGAWYHLGCSYDGSNREMKIYINGQLNASSTHPYSGTMSNRTQPLRIGRGTESAAKNYANAKIDQTALWSRVLSASEFALIYNSGNGLTYQNW